MCGSMHVSIFYAGIGCYIAASCERLLVVTAPLFRWITGFGSAGFVITTRRTPCADPRAHRHISRGGLLWMRAGMSPRSVVAATPHERMVQASRCAFVPAACIWIASPTAAVLAICCTWHFWLGLQHLHARSPQGTPVGTFLISAKIFLKPCVLWTISGTFSNIFLILNNIRNNLCVPDIMRNHFTNVPNMAMPILILCLLCLDNLMIAKYSLRCITL